MQPRPGRGMRALLVAAACTMGAATPGTTEARGPLPSAAGKGIVLPPTTYTVGPEPECDFTGMQEAIDAAASGDSVRVVNYVNYAGVQLEIVDKSLSLVGGFDSCTDDAPDPAAPSRASNGGFQTVLTVDNAGAATTTVLVRHFVLRTGDGGASKGGGVDLTGNTLLRLDNVRVSENSADFGAGVRIRPAAGEVPMLRLEGGTLIGAVSEFAGINEAMEEGGGIHCEEGAIEWIDASIRHNTATSGGGIYLDGCALTMPAPPGGGPQRMAEVADNIADSTGGGIVAVGGSSVSLSSTRNRLTRIVRNEATSGGGVLMIGSDFYGQGIHVVDNVAAQTGGAASVNGSNFEMDRGNPTGANCAQSPRCSQLSGNQAVQNGAALAGTNATVQLRETFVEDNTGGSGVVASLSLGSTLQLASVQVAGNVATFGNSSLMFGSASSLQMRHVTIAGNTAFAVMDLIAGSSIGITDSILWQPGTDIVDGDGSHGGGADCVNASDDTDILAFTHEPGFAVDPMVGPTPLLVLAPDSANLDACDELPVSPTPFDIAGNWRVTDLPDVDDAAGPLDRGAYERTVPLFRDGFEDP